MEDPMEYLKCFGKIKYFINMVNRLDVHSFIYFELASPLINVTV